MGVDLGVLFERREVKLNDLSGIRIAIDGHNTLYQFLSIIRQPDGTPLMNLHGGVTSHLSGLIYRVTNLIEAGIRPIFVFDGKPPDMKESTLQARRRVKEAAEKMWEEAKTEGSEDAFKYAQATSRITKEIAEDSKRLLDFMGIPVVQAPSDGEAQASFLVANDDADYVGSQDYDSLLFGSKILLRNITITGKRKLPKKKVYVDSKPELIDLNANLNRLGITREQLVNMAILIGTDFNAGIKGIGPKRALKLIKKHGNIEGALSELDTDIEDFPIIRDIFLYPDVASDYEVRWKSPEKDKIVDLLCHENDFSEDRVLKALERLKGGAKQKQKTFEAWF
ncbi:MAG: flap endonuclease-1 [Halobacteriota archaeon]|nr:flap endonuclease-1 [Halobacteriota archaeon]